MNPDIAKSDSNSHANSIKSALDIIKNQPVSWKIFGSAAGGCILGILVRKTGKLVAFVAGSGIIILQITKEKGFVTINYSKMSKSLESVSGGIESGIRRWSTIVAEVMKYDNVLLSGLVGGFLIGLSTG